MRSIGRRWLTRNDGDSLTASTWMCDAGITIQSSTFTDTLTTVWLSGGTAGQDYTVTNHVTTAQGRQMDRSIRIACRQL